MSAESSTPFGDHLRHRRERGLVRRQRVHEELADHQDNLVSPAQLAQLGLTYDEVRAELDAGRWHRVGRKTISTGGPSLVGQDAAFRRAVWDVGGAACLDGVSSLLAWGLQKWDEETVHVSVEAGARYHHTGGVRVHVLRRRGAVVSAGIPRTPPDVASLRAAMWARSDRAAATLLAMAVQQRLVEPGRLLRAWRDVGRCHRRAVLDKVVPLVADGAQALSEIDFAELGRSRGWPEPDRQVVVRTVRGRTYLDVRFTAYGVIVEVNGVQHYESLATMDDALRRNNHAAGAGTALEIPAVALTLAPQSFLDQVEAALHRGGWHR
ncbi:hypothetical protein [Ornithinimicrobium cryptoxanthini]|uniref:hypothetical protein n=1 Tax=Ornithinimicrobium cryptoxanthini TaxID=2934161 RepID=UPI002118493D|nr:hypothetical protein [Ornithinimicrobium cryptoxanthini]